MRKQERITQLENEIKQKNICPDLAAQATQLVMGDGNLDADIVFIGEAPGKKEDLEGRPFIGASGRLLETLLDSVALNREDVYITNIVKYRPPNNRDPSKAEKAAFAPFLTEQLRIINPKVVVTLGRHSMEYFLPDATIGDVHGLPQMITLEGAQKGQVVTLVPLYHPAAALFNGGLRQTLMDDFQIVSQIVARHETLPFAG